MGKREIEVAGLTKENVRELFAEAFSREYEVVNSSSINHDFVVKKNAFSGVHVSVLPLEDDTTLIIYNKNAPSMLLRGAAAMLFGDNQVVRDVEELIERIPALAETGDIHHEAHEEHDG